MNKPSPDKVPPINQCGRMNAKSVLEQGARRLREEADALECIAASISWETIKPEVEELIWKYFVGGLR